MAQTIEEVSICKEHTNAVVVFESCYLLGLHVDLIEMLMIVKEHELLRMRAMVRTVLVLFELNAVMDLGFYDCLGQVALVIALGNIDLVNEPDDWLLFIVHAFY